MIKIRLFGERNAIHSLAGAIRAADPGQLLTIQDGADRLSARIDLALPVDACLALFGGAGSLPSDGSCLWQAGQPPAANPGDRYRIDWRR